MILPQFPVIPLCLLELILADLGFVIVFVFYMVQIFSESRIRTKTRTIMLKRVGVFCFDVKKKRALAVDLPSPSAVHLIVLLFDVFLFNISQVIDINSFSDFHNLCSHKVMVFAERVRVILLTPIYLTYDTITLIYYFRFGIVLQFSLSESKRMHNCLSILACYCCSILKLNAMSSFIYPC